MSSLGIKGIEPLLRGANLEGAVLLLLASDSPERSAICHQFVREGLKQGEKVLVLDVKESSELIKSGLENLGILFDDQISEGNLVILNEADVHEQGQRLSLQQIPNMITKKLDEMGKERKRRVLLLDVNHFISQIEKDQLPKFFSTLTGPLRFGSSISLVILDPANLVEDELRSYSKSFDGVLRIQRDRHEEGFTIGATSFEGVAQTGIFLPLRRKGEEYVAGTGEVEGQGTKTCPQCGFQILPGFESCPRCKADLKVAAKGVKPYLQDIFEYLEKLRHESGVVTPTDQPATEHDERKKKLEEFLKSMGALEERDREVAKARLRAIAKLRGPSKRPAKPAGLTNGLAREARIGRVNGLGKTAPGMVNGVGRTNGLVNGLQKARQGLTNGLTNGNGFTNGLGSKRFNKQIKFSRWKLLILPLVATFLLMTPLMVPSSLFKPVYHIEADGIFAEWSSAAAQDTDTSLPGSIDLIKVGMAQENGRLGVYFEVSGRILSGNPAGIEPDSFQAFIDSDNDASTGYFIQGLGADYLLQVAGQDQVVTSSSLFRWTQRSSDNDADWSNWEMANGAKAATGQGLEEGKMEVVCDVGIMPTQDAATLVRGRTIFHSQSYTDEEDFSDFSLSLGKPSIEVVQKSIAPEVSSLGPSPMLEIRARALSGTIALDGIDFRLLGTLVMGDITAFYARDQAGLLLGTLTYSGGVAKMTFTSPISIGTTWSRITIEGEIAVVSGRTVGLRMINVDYVKAPGASVSLFSDDSPRMFTYLGSIPSNVVIDGAYSDWQGAKTDEINEPTTKGRKSIDIAEYDVYKNGTLVSFYINVRGGMFSGTILPVKYPGRTQAPPKRDTDMDSVPDDVERAINDILPFDFNNDNISDSATNHDVDGDGIMDYPIGSDEWLNTTIPAWFGPPYAGRFISLYVGPTLVPLPNKGEDILRIFVDTDNVPGSGFAIGGLLADYMVEISGRNGKTLEREYSRFTGPTPMNWQWSSEGKPSVATQGSEFEAQIDIPGIPTVNATAVFDLRSWKGNADSTKPSRSRSMTRSAEGDISVQQGLYEVELPSSITDGFATYRTEQGYGLSWQLAGIGVHTDAGHQNLFTDIESSVDTIGMDVLYDLNGVNAKIVYKAESERLKEQVVFNSPPVEHSKDGGVMSIDFDVSYIGGVDVRFDETVGVWTPSDIEGPSRYVTTDSLRFFRAVVPAFTLEAPFAEDAGGDRVDCRYSLSEGIEPKSLSIQCPLNWFGTAQYPVAVDPTILMNGYRGENFGYSLATGDFNDDGKDDLLVGAPYNDLGGTDAGRAYVYLGGTTMNNVVDLEIASPAAGSHFGWSVAAGDLNNDGYSDMVIGAPNYGSGSGRVYVNLGASTLNPTIDRTIVSRQIGENFGYSLAVGNFNGDSYKDLLVGAPLNDTGGTDVGSAYIYYGSSGFNTGVDKILHGSNGNERFGYAVGVGNFNNDAYDDAAVGAPKYIFNPPQEDGRVGIFFGGANMDTTEDVNCRNGDSNEELGTSVSSADYNQDGYDDLYGGGPEYNWPSYNGRVEVFYGGSSMDGTVDASLTMGSGFAYFGMALTKGKIVSDSYPEIVVGSPYYIIGGSPNQRGRFDLYWNGAGSSVSRNGYKDGDHFATSLAIGDLNSTSTYAELAVGVIDYDVVDDTNSGRVTIFNGNTSANFDTIPDLNITSKDPGSRLSEKLGYSVAVGDFNNDGRQDVLAGAPSNSNGGSETGVAFIFFGKPFAKNAYYGPDLMLPGQYAGERFGWNVTVGDVNADGYDDAIIGAPYNDEGGTDIGRAYVFYGGTTMNTAVDVDIAGQSSGEMFGWSVASGNVNGDQSGGRPLDDMVIGAPQNGTGKGRVYAFFGSTSLGSLLSTPNVRLYRGDTEAFGSSVAVGNFNQDGYEDILVGAPMNDTASTDIGAAYIYYGCAQWSNCFSNPDVNFYYIAKVSSIDTSGDGDDDTTSDLLADAQNDDATNENNPPSSVVQGDNWYTVDKGAIMHFDATETSGISYGTIIGAKLQVQYSVEDGYGGTNNTMWKFNGAGWAQTTIQPQDLQLGFVATYDIFSSGVNTKAKIATVEQYFWNNDPGGADAVSFDYVWVNVTLRGQQPANITLKGQVQRERFGHTVATGDFDGDSSYLDDAVIGAPFWYDNTNDTGAVYIFNGTTIRATSNGGSITNPTKKFYGPGATTGKFGWSITSGNINGDVYDDLMVGAPLNDSGKGAVYFYYGPPSAMTLKFTSQGEQGERRGWSLAAGDLVTGYNAEVAMGAPWFDSTVPNGRVILLTAIPEFSDVLLPVMTMLLLGLVVGRRRLRRRG